MQRRSHYHLLESTSLSARRPFIISATRVLVVRPDLADRCLHSDTARISDDERRTEAELWADFAQHQPKLLGCILDAVSIGLGSTIPAPSPAPRMADFTHWMLRCEAGLGWTPGTFMQALEGNLARGADIVVTDDPVAAAVAEFMLDPPRPPADLPEKPPTFRLDDIARERERGWSKRGWQGTATELLSRLMPYAGDNVRRDRRWPRQHNALTRRLREYEDALSKTGVAVTCSRHAAQRSVVLQWQPPHTLAEPPAPQGRPQTSSSSSRPSTERTLT